MNKIFGFLISAIVFNFALGLGLGLMAGILTLIGLLMSVAWGWVAVDHFGFQSVGIAPMVAVYLSFQFFMSPVYSRLNNIKETLVELTKIFPDTEDSINIDSYISWVKNSWKEINKRSSDSFTIMGNYLFIFGMIWVLKTYFL